MGKERFYNELLKNFSLPAGLVDWVDSEDKDLIEQVAELVGMMDLERPEPVSVPWFNNGRE